MNKQLIKNRIILIFNFINDLKNNGYDIIRNVWISSTVNSDEVGITIRYDQGQSDFTFNTLTDYWVLRTKESATLDGYHWDSLLDTFGYANNLSFDNYKSDKNFMIYFTKDRYTLWSQASLSTKDEVIKSIDKVRWATNSQVTILNMNTMLEVIVKL